MPAALSLPWIVGLTAAGAGANVAGSAIQAHAAKSAAKTQAQAADKAQAFNEHVYNDQMRMVNPYVQFGTQSLANLGRLSATPFSDQTNGFVSAARGGQTPQFQQGMVNPAQGMSLGQMGSVTPGMMTGQGGQGAALGGGGAVLMRAPDGSQRPVPQPLVQKYLQRGMQVVN